MYSIGILSIAALLVGLLFSSWTYRLVRNYTYAKRSGLPMIVVPWEQNHFFWMVASVPLRPYLKRWLPESIYRRLNLSIYGWEYHEKLRPFETWCARQGNDKTFCLVTCGKFEMSSRDPEIAAEILRRPRDFTQPFFNSMFMGQFGHNVLTSEGESWARQRKIIASVINERISQAVFTESTHQTDGLLEEVYEDAVGPAAETSMLFNMMKKITIHVLAGAGMGSRATWKDDSNQKPKKGFRMNYIESAKTIMGAVAGPIILPMWFLTLYPSFLPGHQFLRELGYAKAEFPIHTRSLLNEERQRSAEHDGNTKSNIVSQLLQAAERDDKSGKSLSEEEMIGNLFVFTAAGFDTTANTLNYALVLLTRYPQWQKWIFEEIDSILPSDPSEELDYQATFPKATRVMAFMFETLRLYTPLVHIAKEAKEAQTITTSKGTFHLPAGTSCYVDSTALHIDPAVWRDLNKTSEDDKNTPSTDSSLPDETVFRPSRWINPPGSQHQLYQPPRGSYVPWSMGPRVCPGAKMAQVEFTAIFLRLFQRHRIEAVTLKIASPQAEKAESEETREELDARLDALMKNSISILTLQMNEVYEASEEGKGVKVRLVRRK